MMDLRAAIDAIERYKIDDPMYSLDENEQGWNEGLDAAIEVLKKLPSTQQNRISGREVYQAGYADGYKAGQEERKTGTWTRIDSGVYCSECYMGWNYMDGVPVAIEKEYKYCPNCGTKMKGEGNGRD